VTEAPSAQIVVSDAAAPEERQAILEALGAFNSAHGYPSDMQPVSILLKDPAGEIIGGLWGKTVYDWMFVEFLIVPDALRGQSIGSRLMDEAERLAAERGCVGAWLTTFAYQARAFYEARGYEVFGKLPLSPRENVRIFMRKYFGGTPGAV
jgi:GNAT superfamily N-acetyltransferase